MSLSLRSVFGAAVFAALALVVSAKIERMVERTFPVRADGSLSVRTQGGDIVVKTVPDLTSARIVARQTIQAKSEAEADELLKDLVLEITQEGSQLRAHARYAERPKGLRVRSWPPVSVSFEVNLPDTHAVDLATSGGDITVGDLRAAAKVSTSGGDLRFGRMSGAVQASTSGGDIALAASAADARLSTSGGDISVGSSAGPLKVTTSGGDIALDGLAGSVQATTSGGEIRARFAQAPSAACALVSSGGGIAVVVPPSGGFDLDASTSGGDVRLEGVTVEARKGAPGKSQLAGPVNGGGVEVRVRTSGGNIRLRAP
jgi:hypothetical protein